MWCTGYSEIILKLMCGACATQTIVKLTCSARQGSARHLCSHPSTLGERYPRRCRRRGWSSCSRLAAVSNPYTLRPTSNPQPSKTPVNLRLGVENSQRRGGGGFRGQMSSVRTALPAKVSKTWVVRLSDTAVRNRESDEKHRSSTFWGSCVNPFLLFFFSFLE